MLRLHRHESCARALEMRSNYTELSTCWGGKTIVIVYVLLAFDHYTVVVFHLNLKLKLQLPVHLFLLYTVGIPINPYT